MSTQMLGWRQECFSGNRSMRRLKRSFRLSSAFWGMWWERKEYTSTFGAQFKSLGSPRHPACGSNVEASPASTTVICSTAVVMFCPQNVHITLNLVSVLWKHWRLYGTFSETGILIQCFEITFSFTVSAGPCVSLTAKSNSLVEWT